MVRFIRVMREISVSSSHKTYGVKNLKPVAPNSLVGVCAQSLLRCFKHKGGACHGFLVICGFNQETHYPFGIFH